jgi:ribonuclease Z
MRPSFHPRLINGPFDDPGLFIPFLFQKRALIFDLGDIQVLQAGDLLKISHAFISHTHMDHFIGFDRLLRHMLGRGVRLALFGPAGFFNHVAGKLAGYAWNLVDNYNYPFILQVTEVHPEHITQRELRCGERFAPQEEAQRRPFNGVLHEESAFKVSAVILDHKIDCLGFSVAERFHINIIKEGLEKLGLTPGPWLTEFKQALYDGTDPATRFEIRRPDRSVTHRYELGDLAAQIATITPGQKITYITDVAYTEANRAKIIAFARDSDLLFIEAAFLEKDHDMGREKHHLTARQAGELAAGANARQFDIFHFSPRYLGRENLLYQEARQAYRSGLE